STPGCHDGAVGPVPEGRCRSVRGGRPPWSSVARDGSRPWGVVGAPVEAGKGRGCRPGWGEGRGSWGLRSGVWHWGGEKCAPGSRGRGEHSVPRTGASREEEGGRVTAPEEAPHRALRRRMSRHPSGEHPSRVRSHGPGGRVLHSRPAPSVAVLFGRPTVPSHGL